MTCKLSPTDVLNTSRESGLLHRCPQPMTCKLTFTRMSTTEDVQAGSSPDVHNRGRSS
ncbi:hypothetical protein DPMN_072178 [Dreissena polymorpha]|uniref:Uncharacterized protein n=1 Tax=Dreissena polymorpha TaxID=45954 RepID=A0A9D3Z8B9_DREPO|nr:hypothetical protein DPMN_071861 [Dreissena polymorpha]KAH3712476.1 hypothetical protein DPMN_072178 [Dreissena polymorpha]